MRRPTSALAKAFLSTALAATTVSIPASAQQPPPSNGSGTGADAEAVPINPARGARHLLRNGWDYINYQEYERALLFFREAEGRKAELTDAERLKLKQGIERAQRGLREASNGMTTEAAYARSGRNVRPGALALAAPSATPTSTANRMAQSPAYEREPIQLAGGGANANPNADGGNAGVKAPVRPAAVAVAPNMSPAPIPPTPEVESVPLPSLSAPGVPAAVPVATAPAPVATPIPAVEPQPQPRPQPAAGAEEALPQLPHDLPGSPASDPGPTPVPLPVPASTPTPTPAPAIPDASSLPSPAPIPAADPSELPPAVELPPASGTAPDSPPAPGPAAEAQPLPQPQPQPVPEHESLPALPGGVSLPANPSPAETPAPAPAPDPLGNPPATAAAPGTGMGTFPVPAASRDSLIPDRAALPPSTLTPELQREVQRIAQRQEEELRTRQAPGAPPGAPGAGPGVSDASTLPGSPNQTRLEISRAPSPTEVRPIRAIPVPEEFVPLPKREWEPNRKYWAAAATCHLPLYFQDASLERYGYSMEQRFGPLGRFMSFPIDDPKQSNQRNQLVQPFFSIGLFAAQVALLPYNLIVDPPWEAEYDLGYYRPGDRVPTDVFYLPLTGIGPPLHGMNYGVAPTPARW